MDERETSTCQSTRAPASHCNCGACQAHCRGSISSTGRSVALFPKYPCWPRRALSGGGTSFILQPLVRRTDIRCWVTSRLAFSRAAIVIPKICAAKASNHQSTRHRNTRNNSSIGVMQSSSGLLARMNLCTWGYLKLTYGVFSCCAISHHQCSQS